MSFHRLTRALALGAALSLLCAGAPAWAREAPWATGESQPEDLSISLVTFGPGELIISWFGHSALAVEDRRLNHGRLYNYGMFSFDDTMLARFAMGRLTFWVGEDAILPTLQAYRLDGRDVRIQELNLSPSQRLGLAKALADNVRPENREYLYHHYFDNCATRPRDMIDRYVGSQLQKANRDPGRMSLRDHTRRHAAVNPPMSLLLDFLLNDEIDKPLTRWDEAFLPEELEKQVAALEVVDPDGQRVPLVKRAWTYHDSARPAVPDQPPGYGWVLLLLGAGSAGVGALLMRASAGGGRAPRVVNGLFHAALGLVFGLPGLVLFLMWTITNHTGTFRNENLLLANPLTLAALPLGLMMAFGSPVARLWLGRLWYVLAALALLALALKALPLFDQDNWRIIALLLPIEVGMATAFALDQRARAARGEAPKAMASTGVSPKAGAASEG